MMNIQNRKQGADKYHYFAIYKPFGVLSQFSPEGEHLGLGSLFDFPSDVYPLGRLDADSEGLLILSNDTSLNHKLLDPKNSHWRTYWVQVEGEITPGALHALREGVSISIQKKVYKTLPAQAGLLDLPVSLPERNPPVRYRKSIPTSWIFLTLREGKNRQVRRMTAAVGFPTLRLVRAAIEGLRLDKMLPGDVRELNREELYSQLKISDKPVPRATNYGHSKGPTKRKRF